MKTTSYFFLILGGLFAILSCQNDGTSSEDRPSAVQLIEKSEEHALTETGIDAIPETNAIYIEWQLHEDSEVNKYEVYRRSELQSTFVLINTVEEPFYSDSGVELNVRYYYYILAMNYDHEKSVPSDTVDYKLLEKPSRLSPAGGTAGKNPTFEWEDINQANDYIVRVKRSDNNQNVWLTVVRANFGSDYQQTVFNSDGTASIGSLSTGVTYQWRVDVIGPEDRCGSESVWAMFTVE